VFRIPAAVIRSLSARVPWDVAEEEEANMVVELVGPAEHVPWTSASGRSGRGLRR
jgi:hypothetical protein